MQSERVNLFDPRQLAIGAVILVVGIGGSMFPGGMLPVVIPGLRAAFPDGLPAIATAAVAGILLNLVFVLIPPRAVAADAELQAMQEPVAAGGSH